MDARLVAGRYRVLRELGRGGMGVVYEVEHIHTGEQLALKLLHSSQLGANAGSSDPAVLQARAASADASLIARFQREARAAAKIRSEHVVRVTDAGTAPELGNAPYFVMELLNGLDLERLVEQRGALTASQVASVLTQVARALDKAHSLGIVHRDLKPENLFLHRKDDGGVIVKILDFGISRFASDSSDSQGFFVTSDGTLLGTPFYMAPEQARGRVHETGPAADIWAMGIITLRLLTGRAYWSANTLAELMVQILSDPMQPPSARFPEWGTRLDAWFLRSCDRDPARRFASAGEQAHEFSRAFAVSSQDEQLTHSLVRLMDEQLSSAVQVSQAARSGELIRTATFHSEPASGTPLQAPSGAPAAFTPPVFTPAVASGQVITPALSQSTPSTLAHHLTPAPRKKSGLPAGLLWGGGLVGILGVALIGVVWRAHLSGEATQPQAQPSAHAIRPLESATPHIEPVHSATPESTAARAAVAEPSVALEPSAATEYSAKSAPSTSASPVSPAAATLAPPASNRPVPRAAPVPRPTAPTKPPAKPGAPPPKFDPLAP